MSEEGWWFQAKPETTKSLTLKLLPLPPRSAHQWTERYGMYSSKQRSTHIFYLGHTTLLRVHRLPESAPLSSGVQLQPHTSRSSRCLTDTEVGQAAVMVQLLLLHQHKRSTSSPAPQYAPHTSTSPASLQQNQQQIIIAWCWLRGF